MSNTEFWGYLMVLGVPVVGSIIALIKPIINLNVNIKGLTDAVSTLNSDKKEMKKELDEHEKELNDHETRISILEDRDK